MEILGQQGILPALFIFDLPDATSPGSSSPQALNSASSSALAAIEHGKGRAAVLLVQQGAQGLQQELQRLGLATTVVEKVRIMRPCMQLSAAVGCRPPPLHRCTCDCSHFMAAPLSLTALSGTNALQPPVLSQSSSPRGAAHDSSAAWTTLLRSLGASSGAAPSETLVFLSTPPTDSASRHAGAAAARRLGMTVYAAAPGQGVLTLQALQHALDAYAIKLEADRGY